jgi:hypothetical protein
MNISSQIQQSFASLIGFGVLAILTFFAKSTHNIYRSQEQTPLQRACTSPELGPDTGSDFGLSQYLITAPTFCGLGGKGGDHNDLKNMTAEEKTNN